jgi:hypothetical protein
MKLVTLLATVISRPSSTHATPRAMMSRVWKPDHPSRSSRAGMTLRMDRFLAMVIALSLVVEKR